MLSKIQSHISIKGIFTCSGQGYIFIQTNLLGSVTGLIFPLLAAEELPLEYLNLHKVTDSTPNPAENMNTARDSGMIKMSRLVGKPTMWFPNRSADTNRAVQAQEIDRSLKFWI